MPFSLQLRHTKSGRHSGQDLRLQAPEIHAVLDSKEFLTLVDVVRYDDLKSCHVCAYWCPNTRTAQMLQCVFDSLTLVDVVRWASWAEIVCRTSAHVFRRVP